MVLPDNMIQHTVSVDGKIAYGFVPHDAPADKVKRFLGEITKWRMITSSDEAPNCSALATFYMVQ